MKRRMAILVFLVIALSVTVALAYPDGSDSSKKTPMPYSSSFSITEGTQTKYWFTPSGKTVNCALSNLAWGVSRDTTLTVKLFTYNSSGS
ncbi:MAG: hypothetical protein VB104_11715 [Candidatus Limiplasma sp.]|nr:hypothetical protein [Candidatus Limiplasma sp.]